MGSTCSSGNSPDYKRQMSPVVNNNNNNDNQKSGSGDDNNEEDGSDFFYPIKMEKDYDEVGQGYSKCHSSFKKC